MNLVDQNAFNKVVSKNRLIKMRSKSETFKIQSIELARSIDSNCVGRIVVKGLGEEISAKRRNG
jgi:hypothetical protein